MGNRTSSAAETDGTNATANGSAAEISGTATAGRSPHHVIQLELMSQHYVEKLLDVSDWKNEGISGTATANGSATEISGTATAGSSPYHVIQVELMSQNYVEKLLEVSDWKNEGISGTATANGAAEISGTATANGSAAEITGTATANGSAAEISRTATANGSAAEISGPATANGSAAEISGPATANGSAAEIPGTATAGSSPHDVIQTELMSQNYVEKLLDVSDWKNEGLKKVLGNFFDECDKTINYTKVVQEYLNSHQSLNISHEQFLSDLNGVLGQQLLMREHLQSFKNHHLQKLHRAQFWTKVSAVGFTAVVVVITTAAAASASAPILPAILTSASILLAKVWESTVSHLEKLEDDAKKHLEIIHSAALGAEITVGGLSSLYSSASQFDTQTKSISEMPDAGEERKKLVEILQQNSAVLRRDIESAKACTLESVQKHLNSLTRLSPS